MAVSSPLNLIAMGVRWDSSVHLNKIGLDGDCLLPPLCLAVLTASARAKDLLIRRSMLASTLGALGTSHLSLNPESIMGLGASHMLSICWRLE